MEILSIKSKHKKIHKSIDSDQIKNNPNKKNCIISLRINTLLYDTLQNYLLGMHNLSDYRFSSISDILRYILIQIEQKGFNIYQMNYAEILEYMEVNIRVTHQQKEFWNSLPSRSKRKIMEKAIFAFSQDKL